MTAIHLMLFLKEAITPCSGNHETTLQYLNALVPRMLYMSVFSVT